MAAQHRRLLWTVLHKVRSPDKQPYNKGSLLRMQIPGYPPHPQPAELETLDRAQSSPGVDESVAVENAVLRYQGMLKRYLM